MKNILFLVTLTFLLASCTNQEETNTKKEEPAYPQIIDSLGLQKYYDDTKWQLYLLAASDEPAYANCPQITLFDTSVFYSSLDLRFDSLYINDTGKLWLYFQFYLNDSTPISKEKFRGSVNYITGMAYDIKDSLNPKTTLRYLFKDEQISEIGHPNLDQEYIDTTDEKIINPLQQSTIYFLNDRKKALHPWLYKEAVKRGVIKEE